MGDGHIGADTATVPSRVDKKKFMLLFVARSVSFTDEFRVHHRREDYGENPKLGIVT